MSKHMTKVVCTLVLTGAVLTGCASYSPTSQPITAEDSVNWHIENSLAVAPDLYLDAKEQRNLFDADLTDSNILAVHVAVENRADGARLVRPSDMRLLLPDGRIFAPSGVSTVVATVGESGSVVGAGVAFGLIGVLVASNAENQARKARTFDYGLKAFPEKYLAKGERAEGVVFFIPAMSICEIKEATIRVRFVDPDSATSETIDVALPGGDYGKMVEVAQDSTAGSNAREESPDPGASSDDSRKCAAL